MPTRKWRIFTKINRQNPFFSEEKQSPKLDFYDSSHFLPKVSQPKYPFSEISKIPSPNPNFSILYLFIKMSLDITLHCIKKQVRSSVIIELKKYTKIWRHCFSLFVLFGIQAFANWWFLMKSNVELNKNCVSTALESHWCSINRSPLVPFSPSSTTPNRVDFTGIHKLNTRCSKSSRSRELLVVVVR